MITSWLTMPPSGLAIVLVSTRGLGIHLGIIAVMAGMEAGTIPGITVGTTLGIHLIIIQAGAMAGMIPGTMAITAGTILGTMVIMVGAILTMEATTPMAEAVATTITIASALVRSVAMVPPMPIVMATASPAAASA